MTELLMANKKSGEKCLNLPRNKEAKKGKTSPDKPQQPGNRKFSTYNQNPKTKSIQKAKETSPDLAFEP